MVSPEWQPRQRSSRFFRRRLRESLGFVGRDRDWPAVLLSDV